MREPGRPAGEHSRPPPAEVERRTLRRSRDIWLTRMPHSRRNRNELDLLRSHATSLRRIRTKPGKK